MARLLLAPVALLGLATCAAPEATAPETEGAPSVGKLQTRDRTIELTMDAFGQAPDQINPNAHAEIHDEIHADIELDLDTPRRATNNPRRR